jgi:hypothetical protein
MKTINTSYIYIGLFAVVLVVLIYGGNKGWFDNLGAAFSTTNTYITNTETINQLESNQNTATTCKIYLDKYTITAGELLTGTINDGKNTLCEVFGKQEGTNNWMKIAEGTTNSAGIITYTDTMNTAGTYNFRVICGDCLTNSITLKVNLAPTDSLCTDTDGKNKLTPGFVKKDSSTYYDDCAGNWAVKEYYCNNNLVAQQTIACDAGYSCFETRGGDYCKLAVSGTPCGETYPSCSGECQEGYICNVFVDHCVCLLESTEQEPPADKYYCCYSMGVNTCYMDSCPPSSQELGVYNTLTDCQAHCQNDDNFNSYTCGMSQWCAGGTCPTDYVCEQVDSMAATWCGCINERLGIVHPDWKVDGQYYNPR